jgi:PD-(D/E)XK nuclease superfamily protein
MFTIRARSNYLLSTKECGLLTYMRLRGIASGLLINFNVQALLAGVRRLLL